MAEIDYTATGIVKAPVSPTAVSNLISANTNDVGTVVTSSLVNKWAKYKPQDIPGTDLLTMTQRKDDHMGLTPVTNTNLKNSEWLNGSKNCTLSEVQSQISEWTYRQPTDGDALRLHDFLNSTNVSSNGYNHNAHPCDDGWTEETFLSSFLDEVVSATVTYTDYNSDNLLGVFTSSVTARFTAFSASLDDTSSKYINNGNDSYLPLSWVMADSLDTTKDWRIGIAVYVPWTASGGTCNKWMFFVSDKPLCKFSDKQSAFPDLATNQWLCKCLSYCSVSKGIHDFDCVPVIITDFGQQTYTDWEGKTLTYVNVINSTIYCMPSGTLKTGLSVPSEAELPTVTINSKDYTAKKKVYVDTTNHVGWYVFVIPNGQKVGTNKHAIMTIVLLYCKQNTTTGAWANVSNTAKTFNGTLWYYALPTASSTSSTHYSVTGTTLNVAADHSVSINIESYDSTGKTITTAVNVYGVVAAANKIAPTVDLDNTNLT